ncbi:protein phosphatase regulator GIP4 KNAG_0D04920 [Huiozyma naganishii CBS 8797]|uniref:GLC7-interacting protein 4 n=1 Tax=Huiozyma naganishii (strain ATCC MYA-139 / BCRC 22969 / CBS 8797 / KCTC 17520 / NBRC 10181 / NCYC 3082 / Yp74L-3) TaxID=1071383 RepID=J7S7B8_HUIN7|nr:hypothetical protein KNAG_0D04920 [Kazachstania naganishii CBS 8797]CCK70231.1 hypothetical protein KNAG_0D04920 [Kazachstania naganishii CBS 8797]
MFAKAAAQVSVPLTRGPYPLRVVDAKLIQFKSAIYSLQELLRVLVIIEKNLKPKAKGTVSEGESEEKSAKNTIIPLITYVLSLCEGHVFNVHPTIRKRYNGLYLFKFYKLAEVTTQLNAQSVILRVDFPPVVPDSFEEYQRNVYDIDLQWRLLSGLKTIAVNAMTIYNKKLRQLQLEKAASINRPYQMADKSPPFNIAEVDDLVRPAELALALDFAVLINDKEKDTSLTSFLKLQWQVTDKFVVCLNRKLLPHFRTYYNHLSKFCSLEPSSANKDLLPGFHYTLHRIYAMLLKFYNILSIMISLTKQIYLPNRKYFHDTKIKLLSKNVFQYEELLSRLDDLCVAKNKHFTTFADNLSAFSESGIKTSNTIIKQVFKDSVSRDVPFVRNTLRNMSSWMVMWKFIRNNTESLEKISKLESTRLEKMLEERRSVDKLAHLEKINKANKDGMFSANSSSSSSVLSSTVSSSISSSPPLPWDVKLLNGKDGFQPPNIKISVHPGSDTSTSAPSLSPANTSRRPSMDRQGRLAQLGMSPIVRGAPRQRQSATGSPRMSRRSSVAEMKPGVKSRLAVNTTEAKQTANNASANTNSKKTTTGGRPRSSSLQSPAPSYNPKTAKIGSNGLAASPAKRSNSLEASDALNQKLVQDTMRTIMSSDMSRHVGNGSGMNSGNRSRSSSVNSDTGLGGPVSPMTRSKQTRPPANHNGVASVSSPLLKKNGGDDHETERSGSKPERLVFYNGEKDTPKGAQMDRDAEEDTTSVKKVRFVGVPPMTEAENPQPKRKGWYKKPSVLHYPPIPSQINNALRLKFNREGVVFRTSLRESLGEGARRAENVGSSMLLNLDEGLGVLRDNTSGRLTTKIREKLR